MYNEKDGRPRWIVDDEEKKRIIIMTSCHSDDLLGGQLKREIKYVAGIYYWMTIMVEDIDNFTASCDVCQKESRAKKLNKNHSSLHSIKVKIQVWYRIGVDLIGPLNETPRGNRYIIPLFQQVAKS